MKKGLRTVVAVLLAGLAALPAAAQEIATESAETGGPIAVVTAEGSSVTWRPLVAYERLVLIVSGPDELVVRRDFKAGQSPTFSLYDERGELRQDGSYTYELRLIPVLDAETRKRLQEDLRTGSNALLIQLRKEGKLPVNLAQSGEIQIVRGAFVTEGLPEDTDKAQTPETGGAQSSATGTGRTGSGGIRNITAKDQVIPDDLIVQGSECVGLDCVNNENFSFDTIRLKENNLRIHFDDTSTAAGFPANDWRLIANDSASGGASKFSIEDSTGAKTPFTVRAGAATNSIFVDSTGRVGFRTSTPVLDLHVNTSNTPAIRLEQNNSGGFTAQTWDIGANEANFFVRDVTGGSKLSFRVRPGAPTSSIDIASDGDVGIGTGSPQAKLHVFSTEANDVFLGVGPSPATGPALNFGYGGASNGPGAAFFNSRPAASAVAPNPSLRFLTANVERMIIDDQGFIGLGGVANPSSPIQHSNGATLSAGGAWLNGSSRAIKQDIAELAADEALQTVMGLAPVKYAYKVDPQEKHVGFIAEDVPDLVATPERKNLSALDIVAVLTKVVQEQQRTIEEQRRDMEMLKAQVAALQQQKQ
ncbi:MAG TPA: tail fiber domain-containing protein [Thermoanaerobaculia bacterium]|nr:tail fiber domain-containing protein [Thermoanaerobaculia bacterium]